MPEICKSNEIPKNKIWHPASQEQPPEPFPYHAQHFKS